MLATVKEQQLPLIHKIKLVQVGHCDSIIHVPKDPLFTFHVHFLSPLTTSHTLSHPLSSPHLLFSSSRSS